MAMEVEKWIADEKTRTTKAVEAAVKKNSRESGWRPPPL
jgi:hypothetical protein